MLPEDRNALIRRVATAFAAKYEKALRKVLDEGWSVYERKGAAFRLASYIQDTLNADFGRITDPDYYDKRLFGTAPKLEAELILETYRLTPEDSMPVLVAAMQAALDAWTALGDDTVPRPPWAPFLWPLLLTLPKFVFQRFQTDFRSLLRTEAKEMVV